MLGAGIFGATAYAAGEMNMCYGIDTHNVISDTSVMSGSKYVESIPKPNVYKIAFAAGLLAIAVMS